MNLLPPPLCLALVLADSIWKDPASGKCTILGTFSTIFAPTFPATHAQMAVYCALTDGRGTVPIKLCIVRLGSDDEIVAEASGEIDFPDPRMVVEMNIIMEGIPFPKPGEYRLQILGRDQLLMERRLVVINPNEDIESSSEDGE